MNTVPEDDGLNAGRVEELRWALRWLAAEPDAAISAFDGIVVGDEIALDLNWWYEVTLNWGLLDDETAAAIKAIDDQFTAMSEVGPDLWSDDAIRYSPEWAAQRERARRVLLRLGVPRADDEIGNRRGAAAPVHTWRLPRLPRLPRLR